MNLIATRGFLGILAATAGFGLGIPVGGDLVAFVNPGAVSTAWPQADATFNIDPLAVNSDPVSSVGSFCDVDSELVSSAQTAADLGFNIDPLMVDGL